MGADAPELRLPRSRTPSCGYVGSSAPSIETKAPGYLLHADDEAIDARRFVRLVEEARRLPAPERLELLTESLSLWRGSALEDFTFDEFAQAAVQELEELRFEAMEGRIAASLELGLQGEGTRLDRGPAGAHPSRERLRSLQMLALYRAGRQVDALEVFLETRLALAEELGLEPSEELKALERMILAHDPALTAGAPATTVSETGTGRHDVSSPCCSRSRRCRTDSSRMPNAPPPRGAWPSRRPPWSAMVCGSSAWRVSSWWARSAFPGARR